jgi:hypothetical protein
MDAALGSQLSHRSRIVERGRMAAVAEVRPLIPLDRAVLDRIGQVDQVLLWAGRLERFRAELRRRGRPAHRSGQPALCQRQPQHGRLDHA